MLFYGSWEPLKNGQTGRLMVKERGKCVCVCPRRSAAFSGRRGKSEKGEREDKRKRSECDVAGGPTERLCQHCVTSADGGWAERRGAAQER